MKPNAVLENGKQRIFYFDLIRALACLSVVMIHVSGEFTYLPVESNAFLMGHLFDSVSRAGVPLFVMISGALMLDENYSFSSKKWKNHIRKLAVFFLFWSVAYAVAFSVLLPIIKNREISLVAVIWKILEGHFHLWFIPMMIGLYLICPLLRLWVKKANMKYVRYFLLLACIFAFILPHAISILSGLKPEFSKLNDIMNNWYVCYPVGYSAYYVLGWYLNNADIKKKRAIFAGAGALIITFVGTLMLKRFTNIEEYVFYDNFSPFVMLYSAAIFSMCVDRLKTTPYPSGVFGSLIAEINRCSLGIYAVHAALIGIARSVFLTMTPIIAIPLFFVVTVILSVLATVIIKKLPLSKWFT